MGKWIKQRATAGADGGAREPVSLNDIAAYADEMRSAAEALRRWAPGFSGTATAAERLTASAGCADIMQRHARATAAFVARMKGDAISLAVAAGLGQLQRINADKEVGR